MSTTTEKRAKTLNSLLRGEISAVETYEKGMEKVGDDPRAAQLRSIHQEHIEACNELRRHVREHTNEDPSQDSGAWGTWAKVVTSVASLFGDKSALKALKEGEEHGVKEYEEALEDENLTPECNTAISTKLLPQTRRHIETLDRIMDSM